MCREDGFGLVEVIVAILVLAIGALGTMTSLVALQQLRTTGEREALSAAIAHSVLQEKIIQGCLGSASGDTLVDPFDISWGASRSGDVLRVQAVVSWNDRGRQLVDTLALTTFCS